MKPANANTPIIVYPYGAPRERGVALVMSLVILLILTILGVASMSTTSLEQKMAGNVQDATRAFQAAESGLNEALGTSGSLDLNNPQTNTFTYTSGAGSMATVVTTFIQFSPPKRGSGYGNNFEAANFDQVGTGTTTTGGKSVIHQGVGQIVPKN